MLDMYYYGEVERISPEAPVPVLKKKIERSLPGGAANVAANLAAAGQDVSVMSVIGDDEAGARLSGLLQQVGMKTNLLLIEEHRPTTSKMRFMGQNNQQMLRYDVEDSSAIHPASVERLIFLLSSHIASFDLVIMSDYLKGVLTPEFTQAAIKICASHDKKVLIDVKDTRTEKYNGAYLLKPNLQEVRHLTGIAAETDEEIALASRKLCLSCDAKYVLTTCGARGMILASKEGGVERIESSSKTVYDVTGAGDTVIAYLAAGIANAMSIMESLKIANVAAGLQVAKVGTASVSISEMEKEWSQNLGPVSKIIEQENVKQLRNENPGKTVVFTNGCFDILHIGHIRYLKEAATMGELLIIGVNSDESVKRLKGPARPVNSVQERMEVLASLEFVDYVVQFEEDTPYELILAVQPDILVKGADYRPEEVVGKDIVEARGGRLELLPLVPEKSTTKILSKIGE